MTHSNMQWCLQVLDDFHLYHEMLLKPSFPVGAISVFALDAVFFLFLQPSPRFWQLVEPGASSVLIIGHCVPPLDVP